MWSVRLRLKHGINLIALFFLVVRYAAYITIHPLKVRTPLWELCHMRSPVPSGPESVRSLWKHLRARTHKICRVLLARHQLLNHTYKTATMNTIIHKRNVEALPNELLLQVFIQLQAHDLAMARRVCRR
jgi:hypothetical protein